MSATSPAAGMTQVHETVVDGAGTAAMKPVDRVNLPAGDTVEFKPGSYHVMLMGLSKDLKAGEKVELDLVFEHAGKVVVMADIRQD
jgi:copper(I)-binding protein